MKLPPVVVLDFETFPIGARPEAYPPVPVGCAVRAPGLKSFYLAWGHPARNNVDPEKARRILQRIWESGAPLLFHNSKFDVEVATRWLGFPMLPWQRIHDTLFLIFLQNPDRSTLSLKPVAAEVLGLPPNERDAVRQWLIDNNVVAKNDKQWGAYISRAPGDIVGKYAIGDVDRTYKLFVKYWNEVINKRNMGEAYDRERQLMPVLLKSEQRGVETDVRRLEKDVPHYTAGLAAVDAWIGKRLKTKELNVDKNEELAQAILKAGAADESNWARTEKTGALSTAKDALNDALIDRPLAGALLYRGAMATCLRTFMRPWYGVASSNKGVIYTSWNQVAQDYHESGARKGARTGRLSSVPSLMNIPTKLDEKPEWVEALRVMPKVQSLRALLQTWPVPQVRSYIIPRRGMVLNNRDYSQQELRILAHYEEGVLLQAYKDDPWLDMHKFVQQVVQQILREEVGRKEIKILNFGLIYGMGIGKLAHSMDKEVAEAKKIKEAHTRGFPGIKDLGKKLRERADRDLPIRTWGGREYYCEPAKVINGYKREFAYKLLNRLVQGGAADNTKQAMINYDERCPDGHLLLNVHDELMTEAEKGERKQDMMQLRDAMMDVDFDVPMLSEGRWSATRWTEMTDLPRGE